MRPHRWEPVLPRPWDSPGKNTEVGCHFLLQCIKVKSESEAAQSCLTLQLQGSSIHGILLARILEWVAMSSSRESSQPRDQTHVSRIVGGFFTPWATILLLLLCCFSCVWLCATPYMAAHQAPPSLGFSRPEHWSGLPFPSPMPESGKWKWSRSVVFHS